MRMSLKTLGAAALIGVVWYSLVAYISARTRYPGRGVIDFLSWLPASLPGIILGLFLVEASHQ